MPNYIDIQSEIIDLKSKAQDILRRKYLKELNEYTNRDVVIYATAFNLPKSNIPNTFLTITDLDISGFMSSLHGLEGKELDIILHSPGGSADVAEQIVKYLRGKYNHIRAIVPQNAMSAATMIACACDAIVMGKHSAIGPIDPQMTLPLPNGMISVTSAQSILDEFSKAKDEMKTRPETIPL